MWAAKIGRTAETLRGWVRQAELEAVMTAKMEIHNRVPAMEGAAEVLEIGDVPDGCWMFGPGGRCRGALEPGCAAGKGLEAVAVSHLDTADLRPGDIAMGMLPIQLVAAYCAAGARYLHLEMTVPAEERGRDLTAGDMDRFDAQLVEYRAARDDPLAGGT